MTLLFWPNDGDQQLAAMGSTIPQDAIASLLHRLVRHALTALAHDNKCLDRQKQSQGSGHSEQHQSPDTHLRSLFSNFRRLARALATMPDPSLYPLH
jgi:hypothetical protein